MYVITGATGNTGKSIAMGLLGAGKKVRIISRNAEKAKELVEKGAEFFQGELTDSALLDKAFNGATAVYLLIPPNYASPNFYEYQKNIADIFTAALEKSKVKFIVLLSSIGAQLEENSGVIFGLRYFEQKLNTLSDANVLYLRPAYFMENLFGQIGMIKQFGFAGSPVKADVKLNMIATADIAEYATKRLLSLDFSGKSAQYLLGERELTYPEVTTALGKQIGKPDLKYVESSYEEQKQGMISFGASENVAAGMVKLSELTNQGKLFSGIKRDKESTTKTSIEEFAKVFAYVYNSSK
jgi:uncharacterized protein YbjT (DUF2867 family)